MDTRVAPVVQGGGDGLNGWRARTIGADMSPTGGRFQPGEKVPLGPAGLTVTRLSVGTGPIGGLYEAVPDAQALATLRSAWRLGVRTYDTAPLYGYGLAEERLGRFLAAVPKADDAVISTKVGRLLYSGPAPEHAIDHANAGRYKSPRPLTPVFDFSYRGAMQSYEASVERLGRHPSIVHLHGPVGDYAEVRRGAYRALLELRRKGTIAAIGVGMSQLDMLTRLVTEGDFDCVLVAGRYTLLDQSALTDILLVCSARGIAVIAAGVFNSGILANPKPGAPYNYAPAETHILGRALAIKEICDRYGVPLGAAAIQFPGAHPAIASVLVGVRSPEEMDENQRLFAWRIPAALWEELRRSRLLPDDAPAPTSAS